MPHERLPKQVQLLYMQEGTQKLEDGHAKSELACNKLPKTGTLNLRVPEPYIL